MGKPPVGPRPGDVAVESATGELLGLWTTADRDVVRACKGACAGCGGDVRQGERVYLVDGGTYCAPACERDASRAGRRLNKNPGDSC